MFALQCSSDMICICISITLYNARNYEFDCVILRRYLLIEEFL